MLDATKYFTKGQRYSTKVELLSWNICKALGTIPKLQIKTKLKIFHKAYQFIQEHLSSNFLIVSF
jgi:hypothetical protein